MEFYCAKCGRRESVATRKAHCDCGGLWKLDFQPPRFDLSAVDKKEWSLFRYRRFMALEGEAWRDVTLGEGMTPIVRLGKEPPAQRMASICLAEEASARNSRPSNSPEADILLKMDYFMPTLSFKDRGAAVLVAHCKAIGVDCVVQDSSGNAGNAVAAYCGRAGIACEIFVPEGTSPKKIDMIRAHGATCTVVPGSRDHCADVCRAKVEREGVYYANHVYNPFFYEGTKTYIYEVFEQLGRIPAHLVIPVGNGTLFLGVMHGLEELRAAGCIDKMPVIIALQSENCDPLLQAAACGASEPVSVHPTPTLAEGIAIGQPMRGAEILEYARKYDVRFVHAPEERILEARAALAKQGIYCEHTTAANYAAYWRYCETYGPAPDTLITMCGAGLKSDH